MRHIISYVCTKNFGNMGLHHGMDMVEGSIAEWWDELIDQDTEYSNFAIIHVLRVKDDSEWERWRGIITGI